MNHSSFVTTPPRPGGSFNIERVLFPIGGSHGAADPLYPIPRHRDPASVSPNHRPDQELFDASSIHATMAG